jgi:hypothetical protein
VPRPMHASTTKGPKCRWDNLDFCEFMSNLRVTYILNTLYLQIGFQVKTFDGIPMYVV